MPRNSPELLTILQALDERQRSQDVAELQAGHASLKERISYLERMVTLGFWALVMIASGQSGAVVETLTAVLKAKAGQ